MDYIVRAMTKDDMDRIANDFAVAATYMQKAGFHVAKFNHRHSR